MKTVNTITPMLIASHPGAVKLCTAESAYTGRYSIITDEGNLLSAEDLSRVLAAVAIPDDVDASPHDTRTLIVPDDGTDDTNDRPDESTWCDGVGGAPAHRFVDADPAKPGRRCIGGYREGVSHREHAYVPDVDQAPMRTLRRWAARIHDLETDLACALQLRSDVTRLEADLEIARKIIRAYDAETPSTRSDG